MTDENYIEHQLEDIRRQGAQLTAMMLEDPPPPSNPPLPNPAIYALGGLLLGASMFTAVFVGLRGLATCG